SGAGAPASPGTGAQDREARRASAYDTRPRCSTGPPSATRDRSHAYVGPPGRSRARHGPGPARRNPLLRAPSMTRTKISSARAGLVACAPPAWGGVTDTRLPTFADAQPAQLVAAFQAIKQTDLDTDVVCTTLDTGPIDVGVELFDAAGTLANTIAA